MPSVEVWRLSDRLTSESGHDVACLLARVCHRERQHPCLVLGMQPGERRGDYQARWPRPLDEARLHALRGLLDGLVTDLALGEQGADEVGLEVGVHAGGLVDD